MGEQAEARAIVEAVLDLQYRAAGPRFDGTFARFGESAPPNGEPAVEWRDQTRTGASSAASLSRSCSRS